MSGKESSFELGDTIGFDKSIESGHTQTVLISGTDLIRPETESHLPAVVLKSRIAHCVLVERNCVWEVSKGPIRELRLLERGGLTQSGKPRVYLTG